MHWREAGFFDGQADISTGHLDYAGTDMDRAAKVIAKALPPIISHQYRRLEGKADVGPGSGSLAESSVMIVMHSPIGRKDFRTGPSGPTKCDLIG